MQLMIRDMGLSQSKKSDIAGLKLDKDPSFVKLTTILYPRKLDSSRIPRTSGINQNAKTGNTSLQLLLQLG